MTGFSLDADEYAEVVKTLLRLHSLATEVAELYTETAGRKHKATQGAQAMVASIDRLLSILGVRAD